MVIVHLRGCTSTVKWVSLVFLSRWLCSFLSKKVCPRWPFLFDDMFFSPHLCLSLYKVNIAFVILTQKGASWRCVFGLLYRVKPMWLKLHTAIHFCDGQDLVQLRNPWRMRGSWASPKRRVPFVVGSQLTACEGALRFCKSRTTGGRWLLWKTERIRMETCKENMKRNHSGVYRT